MIKRFCVPLVSFIALACSLNAYATPFGLSISVPLVDKDPNHLHGYRAAVTYQPPCFVWNKLSVYFDAAYGHWWVDNDVPNKSISIYSVAPYVRYYLMLNNTFSPFIEASIGASILSKTRFSHQNLGIHYAFQDQMSFGAAFGPGQHLYASLSAVHYSNASMSQSNSGITVPVVLNVGYRF